MANIVIIDDNEPILDMMSIGLSNKGHSVTTFDNGDSALAKLKGMKPDFIFIDIFLPSICGYDLIKQIKEDYSSAQIIAISGGFDPFHADSCINIAMKFGAHDGLSKPFRIKQVIDIIDNTTINAS